MKPKVLIVDDTRTVRSSIRIILKQEGYEVQEAENAEEGLAAIPQFRPEVVLLDIMMPGMNGLDCLRQLKGSEATSHMKVIMITTRGEAAEVRQAFDIGCDAYLLKPIERDDLLKKITRLRALSAARSALREVLT